MNACLEMDNGLSPLRVGRITGSRCAAVLGLNPYSTRADVLREMVREHFGADREFTGNEATEWGQAHEPDALAAYEAERGVMTYGGGEIVLHPLHDFLAVTPDGFVGDDGLVECKAPFRGRYTTIAEVPYYVPQVQLQLACTGRAWCDFVVWRDGAISVDRVTADQTWLPAVLPALTDFMTDFAAALASKEAAAPYLADKVADMDSSAEWQDAAAYYSIAVSEREIAEARVKAAREALVDLAQATGCKTAKGCGWQVIRSERAGPVAYAKAIKDLAPDADLSAYTGKPTVIYTVKESAQ